MHGLQNFRNLLHRPAESAAHFNGSAFRHQMTEKDRKASFIHAVAVYASRLLQWRFISYHQFHEP